MICQWYVIEYVGTRHLWMRKKTRERQNWASALSCFNKIQIKEKRRWLCHDERISDPVQWVPPPLIGEPVELDGIRWIRKIENLNSERWEIVSCPGSRPFQSEVFFSHEICTGGWWLLWVLAEQVWLVGKINCWRELLLQQHLGGAFEEKKHRKNCECCPLSLLIVS